jgi:ERCC4-type nuclease
MSAPIDRLTEVDGIGRISAEKIREVLGEEFISD